jgi:solute carrier family 35 protein F5
MAATFAPVPTTTMETSSGDLGDELLVETAPRTSSSSMRSMNIQQEQGALKKSVFESYARRTLGLLCLGVTVFLWTASNFMASDMMADNSYSKPYFVVYVNTAFFIIFLPICYMQHLWRTYRFRRRTHQLFDINDETETFLKPASVEEPGTSKKLTVHETAKVSLEFCLLWFAANYFIAACFEFTTVASSTILMSTSSVWTLIFGALMHVEQFTMKKLLGVVASLSGIVLISSVDFSGETDKNRGSFPHKTITEIAIGNILALASAVLYGLYAVFLKKRLGDESRVDMMLFFGFVGFFNTICLWPFIIVLHYTGLEIFSLPPTREVTTVLIANSITSLLSDVTWAYAMLLISPLVVTVGLSLTIPLAIVGQIILKGQKSSFIYWVGASIVVLSFVFINHEAGGLDGEAGKDDAENGSILDEDEETTT